VDVPKPDSKEVGLHSFLSARTERIYFNYRSVYTKSTIRTLFVHLFPAFYFSLVKLVSSGGLSEEGYRMHIWTILLHTFSVYPS
jgi:hypothetical protein